METRSNLNMSPVCFDALAHTYQLGDKMLEGVTPIVNWVFNKTYDGIRADVLEKAAKHGTAIHTACQLLDDAGIVNDEYKTEVEAYQSLLENAGLIPMVSEYLVSDCEEFASSIDKVFEPTDGIYPLGDIKTTSQLHIENVTLQLSIYAWLFEYQNPELKAGRLFAIWLPKQQYGKPALVEVKRIPSETIGEIIYQYECRGNADYCAELVRSYCPALPDQSEGELPVDLAEVENEIVRIEIEMKKLEVRSKELRLELLERMQKDNAKKWESERVIITRKEASTRCSLDSAKVKKDYPEIYAECIKESKVSESLTIKLK